MNLQSITFAEVSYVEELTTLVLFGGAALRANSKLCYLVAGRRDVPSTMYTREVADLWRSGMIFR